MRRWLRRFIPWAMAAAFIVTQMGVFGFGALDNIFDDSVASLSINQVADSTACWEMAVLSERSAAITGALALVEAGQRRDQAARAAERIDLMTVQAAGTELGFVLDDLADSLAAYASGNPMASASIEAVSARNARLREQYYVCSQEESQNE